MAACEEEWHSEEGVAICVLSLREPARVKRIRVRNHYAAAASVYARLGSSGAWTRLRQGIRLMENAHFEDDAQAVHNIRINPPGMVHAILLRVTQPSPRWNIPDMPRVTEITAHDDEGM